jgi:tetratricopeptide (TPR) repeat protein
MTVKSIAAQVLLPVIYVAYASGQNPSQWNRPVDLDLAHSGGLFSPALDDDSAERPRTPFERQEKNMRTASAPSHSEGAFAPGKISVAELRNRPSRMEANLLERAQRYALAGNHAKAIGTLKEALQESSSTAYTRSFLGVEYLKLEEFHSAITHLTAAVALLPSLAANHSNLGYALCRIGSRASGENELRQALKMDGSAAKTHFVLGVILLDKLTSEAREHLLLANEISRAHLALAVYYTRRGETDSAQEEMQRYLQASGPVAAYDVPRWVASAAALATPASAFGFPPENR